MAIELTLPDSPLQREILESPIVQGSNETKTYMIDYETWGASDADPVTAPGIAITDQDDTTVTSTLCSGGASVANSTQISFAITAVTAGNVYLVKVVGTFDGNILGTYFTIEGE